APRPALAERGDRAEDEARVHFPQRAVADTEPIEMPRGEALDQDISLARERPQPLDARGRVQRQCQAVFAGVARQPLDAVIGMRLPTDERTGLACGVAPGRFDLDYLGAEIGENAAGEVPVLGGEIEHAQTGETTFLVLSHVSKPLRID